MTGLIRYVASHRVRSRWHALVAGGVLLGVTLGLAVAGVSTARDTASSYGRVLADADAEDATIAHQRSPEEAAAVLDHLPGILRHRYQAGFIGFIEGVDPALTGALLSSVDDGFVIELPTLEAGRLPRPGRADEVFINSYLARESGLEVDQRVTLVLVAPDFTTTVPVPVTIVGIGSLPREAVVDETVLTGVLAFTRAFHAEHADLRLYSNSRVWVDRPDRVTELAPVLSREGFEVSETRSLERRSIDEALRPSVLVLVGVGLLAALATLGVAAQLAQRQRDRWRTDDAVLDALGADRPARATVHLVPALIEAVLAAAIAVAVALALSPRAPIGPLHHLDPRQGFHLDLTVVALGTTTLVVARTALTLALVARSRSRTADVARPSRLTGSARHPSSLAGLSLALGGERSRWSAMRLAAAATGCAVLLVGVATVTVSARELIDTPSRYGVDFDVLAFNAFGEQTAPGRERVFGGDDVEAAASYETWTFLVEGRTVPGLGVSPLKGELGPTILDGEPLRHDDEIVLGVDTADRLSVDIGDTVEVQAAAGLAGEAPPAAQRRRVVGLATFAAVSQQGTDDARLGVGALVTASTFDEMMGSPEQSEPEWTVARMADGASATALIARNPEGVEDALGIPTRWFTGARPAELGQLDATQPVLDGAVALSLLLAVLVLVQGGWARTRSNRGPFAVLRALGFTRRELARTAAWQPVPLGVVALLLGLPIGLAAGRMGFSAFARSIAVVDAPSSPPWLVAGLVGALLVATALASIVAARVAGQSPHAPIVLDESTQRS